MLKYIRVRKIFKNLINIFKDKQPEKERLREFELIIENVITSEMEVNFELFVNLFDIVINNNENYINDYDIESVINLYNSDPKTKRKDKLIQEYENFQEVISLAIKTYDFVKNNFANIYPIREFKDPKRFDIFLSHKYTNKYYNLIIFYILTYYYDLNVYVDWIYDYQVNRLRLSSKTVDLLSHRLNQSCNLLFFNLEHTPTTNWMAWEVGYFTGINRRKVGVLDLSNYYGKNRTSIEVLSSTYRFVYNNIDIIDAKSFNLISMVFRCPI